MANGNLGRKIIGVLLGMFFAWFITGLLFPGYVCIVNISDIGRCFTKPDTITQIIFILIGDYIGFKVS